MYNLYTCYPLYFCGSSSFVLTRIEASVIVSKHASTPLPHTNYLVEVEYGSEPVAVLSMLLELMLDIGSAQLSFTVSILRFNHIELLLFFDLKLLSLTV